MYIRNEVCVGLNSNWVLGSYYIQLHLKQNLHATDSYHALQLSTLPYALPSFSTLVSGKGKGMVSIPLGFSI